MPCANAHEGSDGLRLYGKKTLALPHGGGLLTGVAEQFEIREFGPDGELQRVLSPPVERRRLTDEELKVHLYRLLQRPSP